MATSFCLAPVSVAGALGAASSKGGLTSRNSFIGLASDSWGAIKVGKTDALYKNSTAMMNPFSGMLGDYSVIMGNTGGDNRVEFGTRLDHSIWYESPTLGGFKFAALSSRPLTRSSMLPRAVITSTGMDWPARAKSGFRTARLHPVAAVVSFKTFVSKEFMPRVGAGGFEGR